MMAKGNPTIIERVLSISMPFSPESITERVRKARRTPHMTLLLVLGLRVPFSEYMPRTMAAEVALAQKNVHTKMSITTDRIFPRG